ncbi:MAG: DUF6702 family protein [Bacteroidota bacterium]
MNKMLFIQLFCWVGITAAWAHEPAAIYATLKIEQQQLKVALEVPWTFVEGVQAWAATKNQPADFDMQLSSYLQGNFQLFRKKKRLVANQIALEGGSHQHSATIYLSYQTTALEGLKLSNTLLFNIHARQKNTHLVYFKNGKQGRFITRPEQQEVFLSADNQTTNRSLHTTLFTLFTTFLLIGLVVKSRLF